MKPDWKNAPSWAAWLSMDHSGQWCWFEYQPHWDAKAQMWSVPEGQWENIGEPTPIPNATLEVRP